MSVCLVNIPVYSGNRIVLVINWRAATEPLGFCVWVRSENAYEACGRYEALARMSRVDSDVVPMSKWANHP